MAQLIVSYSQYIDLNFKKCTEVAQDTDEISFYRIIGRWRFKLKYAGWFIEIHPLGNSQENIHFDINTDDHLICLWPRPRILKGVGSYLGM